MIFSKALFKQSWKANGIMWGIITFAVCLMLSCVMMISGDGSIGKVRSSISDAILKNEVESSFKDRALNYYNLSTDGLEKFDGYYVADFSSDYADVAVYGAEVDGWIGEEPQRSSYGSDSDYAQAMAVWQNGMPAPSSLVEEAYAKAVGDWLAAAPVESSYPSSSDYEAALTAWEAEKPAGASIAALTSYASAVSDLESYVVSEAADDGYAEGSDEAKEMLGTVLMSLNPAGNFDSSYTAYGESVPSDYDVASLIAHVAAGDIGPYRVSQDRLSYIEGRATSSTSIFLAGNLTQESVIEKLVDSASSYGLTRAKYDSFGFTYDSIKALAAATSVSYQARYDYELSAINEKYADGGYDSAAAYDEAIAAMKASLTSDLTSSLVSLLPGDVSAALEEMSNIDIYSLIVGSVYFKMAGLLLPIIYVIMASNSLIVAQVDSGAMAYVLSTSTKRSQVLFTQASFLVSSLFAMVVCTTIASCVCFSFASIPTTLDYGKLILFNLGSFLVLFAISGLNFLTSCWFDRSKRSMSVGGGISIFFLVATILGLFGSEVMPSIVRFDALNFFNYVSLITLFDTTSIVNGTTAFIYEFLVLGALGLLGYLVGSRKFMKKDLPL